MIKLVILLLIASLTITSVSGIRNKLQQLLNQDTLGSYSGSAPSRPSATGAATSYLPESAHFEITGSTDTSNQTFGIWSQNGNHKAFFYLSPTSNLFASGHIRGFMQDFHIDLIAKGPDSNQRYIGIGITSALQIIGKFQLDGKDGNGIRKGSAKFNLGKPKTRYNVEIDQRTGNGYAYVIDELDRRYIFAKATKVVDDFGNTEIKVTNKEAEALSVLRCPTIYRGFQGDLRLPGQEVCVKKPKSDGKFEIHLALEEVSRENGKITYNATELQDYSGMTTEEKDHFLADYFSQAYGAGDVYDDYDSQRNYDD